MTANIFPRKQILSRLTALLALAASLCSAAEPAVPETSVAGFFPLVDSGREVVSLNSSWRFLKADAPGAEQPAFDDARWLPVNLPHGLELLPANASGGINYQGPAWYRTRVTLPPGLAAKRLTLYFEAVMGRAQVWIDGRLVADHRGGYLPIAIDATGLLSPGKTSVIAVRADNSDDPSYPPGKPQRQLDFCYFGGIYRNAWLIASDPVHITDANQSDTVAGGGVLVHCDSAATERAQLTVRTEIENTAPQSAEICLKIILRDPAGKVVAQDESASLLAAGTRRTVESRLTVAQPALWTPDTPQLCRLDLRLESAAGKPLDGGSVAVGLRTLEFRGREGLWLNGQPFRQKLIGGNRHQDYGYLGNALPDSLQWRDAQLMRGAGLRVVRCHYPQAPAFMDACDRLGIFVIVSTPGWQFWNAKDPGFEQHVYQDIRDMVRRDRNHASIFLWEPILNETYYPQFFPSNANTIVHAEYPYPGAYTAGDIPAKNRPGNEALDVYYGKPGTAGAKGDKSFFVREWGDSVDDWVSQNSDERIARGWGETAQLVQAWHLLRPSYDFLCYDDLCRASRQIVGGCHWASFDCQRGYHNQPFLGGLWDVFRQPKYSRYGFASQRDPAVLIPGAESGPMIFAAWEMSPFSPPDITVFCNCDAVRLTAFGRPPVTREVKHAGGLPSPPVVFTNVYSFMQLKALHRSNNFDAAVVRLDGLINGQIAATQIIRSPKAADHVELQLADQGLPLVADGSDIMPVVATIVDADGHPKHFAEGDLTISVTGAGRLVGDQRIGANPVHTEFGTAPILVRSTGEVGKIVVEARPAFSGAMTLKPAKLIFSSVPPPKHLIQTPVVQMDNPAGENVFAKKAGEDGNAKKVSEQQADFELTH